jgi:hypothetical protein
VYAGGGGGYSSAGQPATASNSGTGGTGYSSTSSYTGKTYATGGNGGAIASPTAGAANTGDGGDGSDSIPSYAGGSGAVLVYVPLGITFNLISGTVNTYTLAGYSSVKEFITSGQFSLS